MSLRVPSRALGPSRSQRARWRARFGEPVVDRALEEGFERLLDQPEAGNWRSSAPSGAELYLPLRPATGRSYQVAVWASGVAAGTSRAINLSTPPISYADLLPTGLQVSIGIVADRQDFTNRTPDDIAVILELQRLAVSGDVNTFYGDQVLPGAGEILDRVAAPNHVNTLYRITGLREDTPLFANGRARLTGLARAVLSPGAAVSVVITAALICQRLHDRPLARLRS